MRNTLKALAPLLALLALDSRAAVLPRTSEATMLASPLERGETAYVVESDGATATLYVGNDAGPLRVSDPSALRGVRTVEVPLGKYTVVPDTNWTASVLHTNGWNLTARVPARIVVTAVDGADITALDYKSDAAASGLLPGNMDVRLIFLGATVVIECELDPYASSGVIWDITPKRKAFGDHAAATDLTDISFTLVDEIGEFDFSHLRAWARDLYNGNRGEDWADYTARSNVKLEGKAIRYDRPGVYTMGLNSHTNLAVNVMGMNAVEIARGEGADVTGTISNTSVVVVGTTMTLTYTTTIANFDETLLRVQENPGLERGNWTFLDPSSYTVSGDTVTIDTGGAPHNCYRLWYDGVASSAIECVFRCSVRFENALYIRGEDSKLYRITVNGGTISATEVQ